MLRFKILVSAVPLMVLGLFARGELLPGPHPCIAIADTSVEISDMPWLADLHVAFTDDPTLASVRVQLSDSAEAADFAVIDGADGTETASCEANPATRLVSISANPSADRAGDLSLAGRPRRITGSSCARRASPRATRPRWWSAPAADSAGWSPPRSESFADAFPDAKRTCPGPVRRRFNRKRVLHLPLTLFSSSHPTRCNLQALCKVNHSIVAPGQGAARQISESSAWDGFSGSSYIYGASPGVIRG